MMPAGDAPPANGNPTPQKTKVAVVVCIVLLAVAVAAAIAIPLLVIDPQDPIKFHVMATEVSGLDPTTGSPVIRPSFGLTLRVENRAMFRDCWEKVTITVFYGDTVVGWGTVPQFCVGKRASVEAEATMSHTDVVLTDALRGYMASQLSRGELEFDVEMRMLLSKGYMDRHCQNCVSQQGFQLCRMNPGRKGYAPCNLFALLSAK